MFVALSKCAKASLKLNSLVGSELYRLFPSRSFSKVYREQASVVEQPITMAEIVEADRDGLMKAAKHLQSGGCVAFPTGKSPQLLVKENVDTAIRELFHTILSQKPYTV